MARPSPRSKSKARLGGIQQNRSAGSYTGPHGDDVAGLPGQKEITIRGGGLASQGPTKIKGPGVNASIKGKVKGMGGGK